MNGNTVTRERHDGRRAPFELNESPSISMKPSDDSSFPSSGLSRRNMLVTAAAAAASLVQGGVAINAQGAETSASDTAPLIDFSLRGKSALVTGAARGIGRAIAV